MSKKILIFSHNFLTKNWRAIVDEQLLLLKRTGLYDISEKIFLGVYSDSFENYFEFQNKISSFDTDNKTEIYFQGDNQNEKSTLIFLQNECKKYDDYNVLYYHTKGVSYDPYLNPKEYKQRTSWRHCMEYFLIERWAKCVDLLETHDCIGILYAHWSNHLINWAAIYFSGNFWWSKTNYINKLPSMEERDNWIDCETLITSIPHVYCNLYHPTTAPFDYYFDPSDYRKL